MGKITQYLYTMWQLAMPIMKNTVVFRSFFGQYNDNPKYISEALHEQHPNIKIVWIVRDGSIDSFPPYAKLVNLDSKEYSKMIARAQVVVDNYFGTRSTLLNGDNKIKGFLFKALARNRKKQLNISTWHGTPLKHIALDEPSYKAKGIKKAYTNSDILLAGCDYTANIFPSAFQWNKNILMCGTPRNDLLFNITKAQSIKEKLGLPLDKKVVLFAPTFRNSPDMSGINQLKEMDLNKLLLALNKKFDEDWCFVFRSHNLVFKKIQEQGVKIDERIIDGNKHEDMAEYLLCSDCLITDYSASMFDYLLTGKPCFLYMPDLLEYRNGERGFYMDISELPFSKSQSFEELIQAIKQYNASQYQAQSADFLIKIGNKENGHANQTVVDLIQNFIETGEKKC